MSNPSRLLLDTHALLWYVHADEKLKNKSIIFRTAKSSGLFISWISLWEVSMLTSHRRLDLKIDCLEWVRKVLKIPEICLSPSTAEIAVEANYLPNHFHGDPADRILVATARVEAMTLVTRDSKITAYAEAGHLTILPC